MSIESPPSDYHIAGAKVEARGRAFHGNVARGPGATPQQGFERLQPIGIARPFVEAQPADAGKAHGDAGFMPGRALQAPERHFENKAAVVIVHDFAHRPEAVDSVGADEAVDLGKLGVGEAEIGGGRSSRRPASKWIKQP